MTIKEAAMQLKVSPGRVRQLIAEGRLKSRLVEVHGLGVQFRAIRQADLDEFKRERKPVGYPAGRPRKSAPAPGD